MKKLLLVALTLPLLSSCGSGMYMTKMDPDPGTENGFYMQHITTKDQCNGATRTYDYEVSVVDTKIVSRKLIGATKVVGTCQEVVVGVSKGILPAIGAIWAADIKGDALVKATTIKAAASTVNTKIRAEASAYAVDNTEPTKIMNMEDNRTFVDTDVGVGVGVDVEQIQQAVESVPPPSCTPHCGW